MSTRVLFTPSFQSPEQYRALLSYLNSGQVTPFQIFNEVIMPTFAYHANHFPTETEYEIHKSSSSSSSEEDSSSCNLQTILQKIQSDLIYIKKACGRLKQLEDLFNDAIRELVLQSLDDAFKERTETLENSTKTNFLHNRLDKALKIISSLRESFQLPNLNSESLTRAEVNLHHSSHNITEASLALAFKETEAAYTGLDETRQSCFLCFSVFPENATIKKKVLFHWWVGEGFIDTLGEEGKTAEKTANEFFEEFREKGLIQLEYKKSRTSADSCTMDPATRYAVIELAKRYRFFNFDADRNPTEDFTCSGRACLVKTEEGSSILKLPCHFKQEKVRSMINVNEPNLDFGPDWFSKMKNVKVLQLGRWRRSAEHLIQVEDSKFLKGLKNMSLLRYLSLRGVTGISELPAAVCELSNLRILNLNGCLHLEKIPQGIGSLKNLTHLDMYECYLISHMPKGLASLSQLQVLKGFVIGEPRAAGGGRQPCKLADLSSLQHLTKLSIHVDKKFVPVVVETELVSLADFKKLRSLSISWSTLYRQPPPTLQRRLTKKLPSLPKLKPAKSLPLSTPPVSPPRLALLEKLNLNYFPYSKIPEWLTEWELNNLKKLYIREGGLSDLSHPKQRRWNVEILRLKFLDKLQMDWPRLQKLFPELNYLEVFKCPNLISSMPCDREGVWKKAMQEEASNSNHH